MTHGVRRLAAISSGHGAVRFPQFVWIWNRTQGLSTPQVHLRMALWLEACWRDNHRELLLLAFRSSGKSTLVGLFCAWLLHVDHDLRILVLAGDFALSRKMVRNVKRIIERHPVTRRLVPRRSDHWASDQFTVRRKRELRDPSMLAKGIAANITGLRADVIICDDVEVPNTCDTPNKRQALRAILHEMEYVLVPGGLKLFVGTPHTYFSIYTDAPLSPSREEQGFLRGYKRLEIPIVDQEGRSQWPERFSQEKIARLRERTGPNKFASQMLLRPRNILDGRLDANKLKLYDDEVVYAESNRRPTLSLGQATLASVSCWWDPAYGSPNKGDRSVIAAVFTDTSGCYWLHRVQYIAHDPTTVDDEDEASQLCRQVIDFVRALFVPAITIEVNGVGRFLPGLLRHHLRAEGVACAVLEHHSHRNKDVRIMEAFDAVLAAGRLNAHRDVWNGPFIQEMREWRPGGNTRDDGLDAVAGCLSSEPIRLPRVPLDAKRVHPRFDWRAGVQHQAASDFDF